MSHHDDLWDSAVKEAVEKLPEKHVPWLLEPGNQKPYTTTQLLNNVAREHSKSSSNLFPRFFTSIDPILVHIASFQRSLAVIVAADPTGAGLIWGVFHLLIEICCRTERLLETILDFNCQISHYLNLFTRWRQFFPDKDFQELAGSIRAVYLELIKFWVSSIRHLRRNVLVKRLAFIIRPQVEATFIKSKARILSLTERVRDEVSMAQIQSVRDQLESIKAVVSPASKPPTTLPHIRFITHSRNHRFFGRKTIIDEIDRVLSPDSTCAPEQRRFVLFGAGGSGKTQIALEYTYRAMKHFKIVLWIIADSAEKIEQSFRETAELLGMPNTARNSSQAKTYVLQRLSSCADEFLLCFDNADNMSLIDDCFPRSSRGAILITTRDASRSGDYAKDTLLVSDLSMEEATGFLTAHLNRLDLANDEGSTELLWKICKLVHGYPLALSHIAAFIRKGGHSLARFIQMFQDKSVSSKIFELQVHDYHATWSTIWELCRSSLSSTSEELLDILSFLDPDSIPYELFEAAEKVLVRHAQSQEKSRLSPSIQALIPLTSPITLHMCLEDLQSQSMVHLNPSNQSFSIHRYLQENVYEQLSSNPARLRSTFEQALFLLTITQPAIENTNRHWSEHCWAGAEKYLSHINVLGSHFLKTPQHFTGFENQLGKLTAQGAMYFFERFNHHAAGQTFNMTKAIFGLATDPDIVVLSDSHRIEARMFNELNRPIQSLETGEKALQYAEAALKRGLLSPHDDARIPRILTGLGNSLSQLGSYGEAKDRQLEALKLAGNIVAGDNDAIGIIQLNWGFLLHRLGRNHEAERVLQAAIQTFPDMAPAYYPLGNVYLAMGQVDDAIAEHLKGLKLYKTRFGPQHAVNAKCMFKVGAILLRSKGEPRLAMPYLRWSLEIYQNQDAPYYNTRAASRSARMLAEALRAAATGEENLDLEQKTEAESFYQRAWDLREKITGVRGSPLDTDDDYNNAMFYWDQ